MARKVPKTGKRRSQRKDSAKVVRSRKSSQDSAAALESWGPKLAIGEAILFGDYWASKAHGTGNHELDTQQSAQSLVKQSLQTHTPICPEVKLAQRFITSLGRLHMQTAFCLLVPSYIGHSPEIDLAVEAVIAALECPKGKGVNNTTARVAYGRALTALRQKIDFSDSSLLTVALLSLYEAIMRMHTSAQFSHRYGIAKIMLSRPKRPEGPSELERSLLFSDWDRRWRAPTALGIVSPFEDSYWLNAEPRKRHSPEEIVRLRMLTNQMYIMLPRLTLYVRRLRESSESERRCKAEEAASLANQLLELRDKDAESFMLHGVKVVPTKDQWDRPIVRYSFEFQTLQQMAFANAYWHTRLLLMQLCLKIFAANANASLSQDEEDIKSETKRMVTNVFMSYQFAKTLSMMGHINIAQPLVASFGALSCLDRWQDLPISSVKTWIVLRMNDTWSKWGRSFSSKDLEEITSVFSGGPLEGTLPKSYEDERQFYDLQNESGKG
jgi:hypothetical protein